MTKKILDQARAWQARAQARACQACACQAHAWARAPEQASRTLMSFSLTNFFSGTCSSRCLTSTSLSTCPKTGSQTLNALAVSYSLSLRLYSAS